MRVYVVEGTPEEIRLAIPELSAAFKGDTEHPAPVAITEDDDEGEASEEDAEQEYVSVDVARSVLNRRKLHDSQKAMLRAMYDAHPDQISASDLQAILSQTTAQFRGFMGSWGRRYSHTEGWVDGEWFFEQEWDDEQACYLYRLPDSVCEALRLEKLV